MAKSFLDLVNNAMRGLGNAIVFPDSQDAQLSRGVWPKSGVQNVSAAAQNFTASTRMYIAGSGLLVPSGGLRVGATFKWRMNLTKTGAGSATSTFDIAVGVTGTTTDTAQVSFTKPAGTTVIDEGWIEITGVIQSIGATGVMVGEFTMTHNLAATGHATIPVVVVSTVSAGFDMRTAGLIVGLCITSGAGDVVSTTLVQSEAYGF